VLICQQIIYNCFGLWLCINAHTELKRIFEEEYYALRDGSLFTAVGWHRRETFFLVNGFLIQPLKSREFFYPPLAKKLYKTIPFSCHTCPLPLLGHDFDNCLCLHMYFLLRHHLPHLTNWKIIKIVTLVKAALQL
jgi:hypothetical protein